MTEIDNFILSKTNVTDQTKRNYRNQYKSIVSILGKPILNASESEIINAVHQLANGNYSCEWTYMNIPFMIRAFNGLSNELINKRREELKGLRDFHTETSKSQKQDSLPQMKEIKNYIKELFNDKKYKLFIVNYLISQYGVRNKDVNAFIVSNAKDVKDESQNYLIVKKNEVIWLINDYKTLSSYGAKKIIIKAKAFLEAINALPLNTWLLTGTPNKLNESGLGTTIKRMLYKNLSEGDYMKAILNDINNKPNTTKWLEFYSKTRGTNFQTLLDYYDTSKKVEINENDDDI
jgi:ribosomal protein S24E